MTYELSTVHIERNGKKIFLTQVEEFLVDNRSVYKYIYNVLDGKGGLKEPHIFYSETNVLNVVRGCGKKKKLESQLREARRKGDTKKIEEITNANLSLDEEDNIKSQILIMQNSEKATTSRPRRSTQQSRPG